MVKTQSILDRDKKIAINEEIMSDEVLPSLDLLR